MGSSRAAQLLLITSQLLLPASLAQNQQQVIAYPYPATEWIEGSGAHGTSLGKEAFISALVSNMTIEDLGET